MTLWDLCCEGEAALKKAGVDDAALDAALLLYEAFSIDAGRYLLVRNNELGKDDASQGMTAHYRDLIEQRACRIPLQRIVGSTEFMGLTFSVKENVLIPRQDTETLVEKVLADCAALSGGPRREESLLDLCTGSGCIAISLAVKGNFSRAAASDISKEAIDAARENAARYDLCEIEFYQGDLFSALPRETPPFSVITANPPYIPTGLIASLQPEVRDHDPFIALDGSSDGLEFYRRIAAEAAPYLTKEGRIYMEIGFDQAAAVCDIFASHGFNELSVVRDLSGNDRVVVAGGFDAGASV